MGAEFSAEFATLESDDWLIDYVRERNSAPFQPRYPDTAARYADRREVNLDDVRPLVALPDAVIRNCAPVDEVAGEPVQQAFLGSCANGTLDDLAEAARVVKGRKIAPGAASWSPRRRRRCSAPRSDGAMPRP